MPSRRQLLLASVATLAVGCSPTPSLLDTHQDTDPLDSDPSETGMDTGPQDTGPFDTGAPEDCGVTASLDSGPFFRPDAPDRTDLRTLDEEGVILSLRFQVRSAADCALLPGTSLELWHCQRDGMYDMQSEEMHYRCKVTTGEFGRVVITTLRPPGYGDPDNRIQAHLHLKLIHPEHTTLVTQLRFANDPDDDGSTPASLYLDPTVLEDGSEDVSFVFSLSPGG